MKVIWKGKVPDKLHPQNSVGRNETHRLIIREDTQAVLGEVKNKEGLWQQCEMAVEKWMCEQYIRERHSKERG